MRKCDHCGSPKGNFFEVTKDGHSQIFDTFDCAIAATAEECRNCGCLITGKLLSSDSGSFCCQSCQDQALIPSKDVLESL